MEKKDKKVRIKEITHLLEEEYKIIENSKNSSFTNFKDITDAKKDSLVWVSPSKVNRQQLVEETKANW